MKDPEVLALAAEQQRVLVSHDAGMMPRYFRKFRDEGKRSAGVLLIPQSLASDASEWESRLEWLPL